MPRIKIRKIYVKKYVPIDNYIPKDEEDDDCNDNLQPSEIWNADLQCDRTRDPSEANSVFMSTQNNRTSFLKDTKETPQHSTSLQENQDFKSNKLPGIENEPHGNDSNSKEDPSSAADSQPDHDHPSSSQLVKNVSIRTIVCDINSDSRPPSCENSAETQRSEDFECSIKSCERELDHSNSSGTVDVKSEKPDAENNDDSSPNQDVKRSRRNSKRKRDIKDHCPVCGLTIRCADLEGHFAKEVESLSNISKNRRTRTVSKEREGFRCGVNLAFLQAKTNRQNRITARKEMYGEKQSVFCPVCRIKITGTDEEINGHVCRCCGEDDESDIDINITDYDENFEEYEIGNETRVRAISLVPGGHRSLHGYASKSRPANDDYEGDLNVDVDDTMAFGEPQYTELDVIHNAGSASDKREREQLRRAVVSDPSAEPHVIESKKWSNNSEIQNEINEITSSCVKDIPKEKDEVMDTEAEENIQERDSNIISSLKERIRDLEQQKNVKCLICLEPYTRPVVSTSCWHVHCEECWLVSMGVKKLCPQCNMIVFPTDLRRIYI